MSEASTQSPSRPSPTTSQSGGHDGALAGPPLVHRLLDQLIARFAEDRGRTMAAKEDFLERAGKVFDDDAELFEARIAAFLEWYVLECPLPDGRPPVEHALDDPAGQPKHERATLAALATSHRSLFDVVAVSDDSLDLEDLLRGARFRVRERRSTAGFETGQVVEVRLIWDGHDVIFGRTFVFHPVEARDVVLEMIERMLAEGKAREDIMFHLSRLHTRWYRSKNVSAPRAYGEL